MTTTDTATVELTVEDVKAIKDARSVVPFYRPNGDEGPIWGVRFGTEVRMTDPIAEQRIARIKRLGVWTLSSSGEHGFDYTHTVAADPARCTIERYNVGMNKGEVIEAVAVLWTSFTPHVLTALKAIRPGDSLGLRFIAGNSNLLAEMGWALDEFFLRIIRKNQLVGEYMLGAYAGPDNTARFVR